MRIFNLLFRYLYPKTRRKFIGIIVFGFFAMTFIELYYYRNSFHKLNLNEKLSSLKYLHDSLQKTGYLENHYKNITLSKVNEVQPKSFLSAIATSADDRPLTFNVLVLTESENSNRKSNLKQILNSWKINFDFITWNRLFDNSLVLPRLQDKYGYPRYHAFIFLNHLLYDELDIWTRHIVFDYCRAFNVGLFILVDSSYKKAVDAEYYQMSSLPINIKSGEMDLRDFETTNNKFLKFSKCGRKLRGIISGKHHALFYTDQKTFEPLALCKRINKSMFDDSVLHSDENKEVSILLDKGENDNIKKIFFGSPISTSFLHKLLFLDALSILSNGVLGFGVNRHIQIDIDDIFVGQTGKKLIPEDVMAMVEAQNYFASIIPGFKFNLGFSAKFFNTSNATKEREADLLLVKNANKFRWFCHMFKHRKPHLLNKSKIIKELSTNKKFAEANGIKVDNTYSVSPHHSGIYPVHDALYDAWKEVLGIKVTSTEGYPHLYPAWNRKGFAHKDVFVLPRQTCGLFTKTLHIGDYPKGPDFLQKSSHGGELFWTIVENPVSIFMTHAGNYGFQERLAIDLFTNVTSFIRQWTNIKLIADTPLNIADKYFSIFPRQLDPIWGDPCNDLRHKRIWNGTYHCQLKDDLTIKNDQLSTLPDFFIVGPQKTGTTALHSFLTMHPNIYGSRISKHAFEEVQFFNRNNYMKGLQWYLDYFPKTKAPGTMFFDKSANYFDSLKTPYRVNALVPKAKIIAILIDPRKRAYSWYQHVLSKKDSVAENHTFYEIITWRNESSAADVRIDMLQKRCLLPGLYALSLERWLQYYKPENILLIDGNELRYKPHVAMKKVSEFLKLPEFPFHKRIRYSTEKGFFCSTSNNGNLRCLGKSKGRQYRKMGTSAYQHLADYYRIPNLRLAELLKRIRKPLPGWLKKESTDK